MFPALLLSLIVAEPAPATAVAAVQDDPPVRITLNNDRRFVRGDRAKVKVRVEDDGFLLVLHADPDGRVRVLFPLDPDDDGFVRGDRTYEIRGRGDREAFTVDAGSGEGAVYAAVSPEPYRFGEYVLNAHWDYNALNTRTLPEDPEPELTELVRRMSSGRFEYDYLTYSVFRYDDVAYRNTVIHRTRYVDPFCGYSSYFVYDCDPYYYTPRYSLRISFGRPYYYGYWDPFYDPWYYPGGYYRAYNPYPYRYYDPYPYRYYGGYYGGRPFYDYPRFGSPYPYRNRMTPSGFKQLDRRWDGDGYRDRIAGALAGSPAPRTEAVNTVYGEPPVRRSTINDPGRSPVTDPSPSRDLSDRPSRRTTEQPKARSEESAGPRRETPTRARSTDRAPRVRSTEDAPRARSSVETPRARGTAAAERPIRREGIVEQPTIERAPAPREASRRDEPRLERRRDSDERPARAEPSRSEPRAEPRRAEPAREEPRRADPIRAEPMRASPSYSEPRAVSSPRHEPGGGGGGGRRSTR